MGRRTFSFFLMNACAENIGYYYYAAVALSPSPCHTLATPMTRRCGQRYGNADARAARGGYEPRSRSGKGSGWGPCPWTHTPADRNDREEGHGQANPGHPARGAVTEGLTHGCQPSSQTLTLAFNRRLTAGPPILLL